MNGPILQPSATTLSVILVCSIILLSPMTELSIQELPPMTFPVPIIVLPFIKVLGNISEFAPILASGEIIIPSFNGIETPSLKSLSKTISLAIWLSKLSCFLSFAPKIALLSLQTNPRQPFPSSFANKHMSVK